MKYFKPSEFTDGFEHADPVMLQGLDHFRELLNAPIYISPAAGALARFDDASSGSGHYAVGRKSDAIDVFCEAPPARVYQLATTCGIWGGVGVYFDTTYAGSAWTMFHLDQRPGSGLVYWCRGTRAHGVYDKPMFQNVMLNRMFRLMAERGR